MSNAEITKREIPPFRYDIVGSFLRPLALKEARAKFANGEITREDLREVENEEIIKLIEKQKEVGLKAVTDGEFRRKWWHLDFLSYLDGITVYDFETQSFGGNMIKAQGTYVSAPLRFNENHPFLEDFKFTKQAAGDVLAKQTIPGPNMIFLDSMVLAKQYKENPVYADHEKFKEDLAKVYQDAIQAFYDAGCRYLQLDDTSWGALFSERFRGIIEANGFDPDKLIGEFGDVTEMALAKRPKDMAITFHMCKGNFRSAWLYEGSYDRIAKRLLAIKEIDGFFLEFDDDRSGGFEPLANIGKQMVVLGLVTSKNGTLENKEDVIARIHEASAFVPLNQLCLSPQCGFASTEEGNILEEEDQWKKLKLVKEIAEEVWGK